MSWQLRAIIFASLINTCACDRNTGVGAITPIYKKASVSAQAEVGVSTSAPPDHSLDPAYISQMVLPEQLLKILRQYDSEFKLWDIDDYSAAQIKDYHYSKESLPYSVKGDYNGDGIIDIALSGHNKDSNLIIALVSSATGYYLVEIATKGEVYKHARNRGVDLPYTPGSVLFAKKKGQVLSSCSDMAVSSHVLKNDGVIVKQNNPWPNIYEWSQPAGKFKKSCVACERDSCMR